MARDQLSLDSEPRSPEGISVVFELASTRAVDQVHVFHQLRQSVQCPTAGLVDVHERDASPEELGHLPRVRIAGYRYDREIRSDNDVFELHHSLLERRSATPSPVIQVPLDGLMVA